jgi:rhamnosyltransferase
MNEPFITIILRSFNEAWALRDTLSALKRQSYRNWELIVIDSGSTDGSPELIRAAEPVHFIEIRPHEYNPGRVMNLGMRLARSNFGIFLNADATPLDSNWLRPLVTVLQDFQTAAVFGRQIPRPNCQAVYACDYERCFGPGRESATWDHFFSMVSSGLRKDIWSRRGFLENLQYAEDDEYTRWARSNNYKIAYSADSVVMHSHNYTPAEAYKRSFGDAKAVMASSNGGRKQFNFIKTCLLGWMNDLRHDVAFCLRQGRAKELPHAARIRWVQRRGKLNGFREGWREYRRLNDESIGSNKSLSPALSRGL